MAEPHLDHPGEIHWYKGYGPSKVIGFCPHGECPHNAQGTIAHGPDFRRYVLVQCDVREHCNGGCRAWSEDCGRITTPWLEVEAKERLFSKGRG